MTPQRLKHTPSRVTPDAIVLCMVSDTNVGRSQESQPTTQQLRSQYRRETRWRGDEVLGLAEIMRQNEARSVTSCLPGTETETSVTDVSTESFRFNRVFG